MKTSLMNTKVLINEFDKQNEQPILKSNRFGSTENLTAANNSGF